MTSMHRHDFDYSFVAIKPSRLEVFGEDGTRLFDFWATESSLKINGDFLEPTDENIKVRNIWGFSPLVPSKREKNVLVLLS